MQMIVASSNKLGIGSDVVESSRTAAVIVAATLSISPDTVVVSRTATVINAITIRNNCTILGNDVVVDIRGGGKTIDAVFIIS